MNNRNATYTGRIKITSLPRGEAPEEVRAAWIELELPCLPVSGSTLGLASLEMRAATRNPIEERTAFFVPQDEALRILEAAHPAAARWWHEHGYPNPTEDFCFGVDEAEVINNSVRHQQVRVWDDMDRHFCQ
jgi:hypothetical protein